MIDSHLTILTCTRREALTNERVRRLSDHPSFEGNSAIPKRGLTIEKVKIDRPFRSLKILGDRGMIPQIPDRSAKIRFPCRPAITESSTANRVLIL